MAGGPVLSGNTLTVSDRSGKPRLSYSYDPQSHQMRASVLDPATGQPRMGQNNQPMTYTYGTNVTLEQGQRVLQHLSTEFSQEPGMLDMKLKMLSNANLSGQLRNTVDQFTGAAPGRRSETDPVPAPREGSRNIAAITPPADIPAHAPPAAAPVVTATRGSPRGPSGSSLA